MKLHFLCNHITNKHPNAMKNGDDFFFVTLNNLTFGSTIVHVNKI